MPFMLSGPEREKKRKPRVAKVIIHHEYVRERVEEANSPLRTSITGSMPVVPSRLCITVINSVKSSSILAP